MCDRCQMPRHKPGVGGGTHASDDLPPRRRTASETGPSQALTPPVTAKEEIPLPFTHISWNPVHGRYPGDVIATLTRFIRQLRDRSGAKLLRFGAVSAFNVVFGQTLLYGAQTVLDWAAVTSNIFSVTVSAVPAYLLSRYWVWQKRGKNHLMKEVLPFWSLAILGFVLSTTAVWFVEKQWDPQPIFINLTNLTAFGVVWVSKFFILDRFLFRVDEPDEDAAPTG